MRDEAIGLTGGGTTTLRWYEAPGAARALILAHGAGAGQTHPFMVRVAAGLAARGLTAVTFNFRYMEARRKTPDRAPVLVATWLEVIGAVRASLPPATALLIGGKSMGGRMASHVAAGHADAAGVAGLVCLGYPLHPPGRPDTLRVEHLAAIACPTLVVQGTRDEFGRPDELAPYFDRLPRSRIVPVPGGDHSFGVPRSSGRTTAQVLEAVLDTVAAWAADVSPAIR
jgi:predicted alpha/beta-hydrolase family hydrolase